MLLVIVLWNFYQIYANLLNIIQNLTLWLIQNKSHLNGLQI